MDTSLEISLEWTTEAGVAYFIEVSSAPDFSAPEFYPFALLGDGGRTVAGLELANDGPYFFRLQFSSDPNSELLRTDFDADRVDNGTELEHDSDPFDGSSRDGNSIPDDWERLWLNRTENDEDADDDGDRLSLIGEFLANTSPLAWDSDGDGLSDADDPLPTSGEGPPLPAFRAHLASEDTALLKILNPNIR